MIRAARPADTEAILMLWLRSSLLSHAFIAESYWIESLQMVREDFLPKARTWVDCDENDQVCGFISVLNQQFIGALFVEASHYGDGTARRLMAAAKEAYPVLLLEVYQQNHRAVSFYRKENFEITANTRHPGTDLPTYILRWYCPLSE
ncbi:N-acetyltransferase [Rahnella sp. C60]|uniref:N-acetyltransferase n=2 Tax=Rahnella perminowiae TaxID=2816244 RepID=A0ABS6L355_9GAMM|nr:MULTISPECIES: N-acetyltransferase [Rahnella]UJD87319.1 N-acetyltransferase [Rahnella aquatilis]MBU9810833.1 N-acetyltransferase [Rahnella perminowiae]MBU9814651.1 N-acetyltransferase [Rahnella perminowiae]MBU9827558.1 N-acetyltransferase [Rahnella perminowiae]MBU9835892.1 N-acetyltransferase [Rahnella perminowiae]